MSGWIGVDLDGTLAYYDEWRGIEHIGKPIPLMVGRVKEWLEEGREVRIFTARVSDPSTRLKASRYIEAWCEEHIGQKLHVTCIKDFKMISLYDDRAFNVIMNTGLVVSVSAP